MQRKPSVLSLILLGTGVFLLTLAPLLVVRVLPEAKRTPLDIDTTTVFTGTGSYFDTTRLKTVHEQKITITRQVRGDVAAGASSGNAVWDVATSVDTDATLPASDPRDSLQWTRERWVTDRRSNAPVHCCKESPAFDGEAYLKFPFDVEERDYLWWDGTLGGTVLLRYTGAATVQGHEGMRFTGSVPPTRTGVRQVPGKLVGLPDKPQVFAEEWYANNQVELVVDQRTGRILHAATGPRKTLRAPKTDQDAVVLMASDRLAFTEQTQRHQVQLAEAAGNQLELLGSTVPLGAGTLGAVLALAGGILVFRGRSADPTAPVDTHPEKHPTG
ncbi:DUF3068 domain-containing protein [Streptomyces zaomyceticus]|uniref:DUF3068 domain-containing protein n=1 Tax=Streptomyces zaomyceticus TaxID=68286 RepID=UPI00342FA3D0